MITPAFSILCGSSVVLRSFIKAISEALLVWLSHSFFSNPIPALDSREYSSTSIKEIIKDIIQSEGTKKHLSDQKITDLLLKRGIKIARRTIAKYRKGLKILPSNLRR